MITQTAVKAYPGPIKSHLMARLKSLVWNWLLLLAHVALAAGSRLVKRKLVITPSADGLTAILQTAKASRALRIPVADTGSQWSELQSLLVQNHAHHLPIDVLLPDEWVLTQTLTLPAATRDVLDPIMRNHIPRLTPWPEDEVLFGYRVKNAANDHGPIEVDVVFAPKAKIGGISRSVSNAGLRLRSIAHGSAENVHDRITLIDFTRERAERLASRIAKVIAGLAVLSLLSCVVGTYRMAGAYRAQAQLSEESDTLNSRLRLHDARLMQRAQRRAYAEALIDLKRSVAPTIWVLRNVTKVLPDEAWLNSLVVSEGKVVMLGNARNSAQLVTLLEQSGHFAEVHFASPTVREPGEPFEMFTIKAKINDDWMDSLGRQ